MSCVSAFSNILHFIGEIFDIPENVPRFLKNVFHNSDVGQLGLASLLYSEPCLEWPLKKKTNYRLMHCRSRVLQNARRGALEHSAILWTFIKLLDLCFVFFFSGCLRHVLLY